MSSVSHSEGGPALHHTSVFGRMLVCGPCGDVVGPTQHPNQAGVTITQIGTCPVHGVEPAPRWAGFDFNRFVELCRCCGTVAIQSGSRWSVWFCPSCKEQVGLLNGRLGRCAIPIGRHSAHAGWLLRAADVDQPLAVQVFTDSFGAASRAMPILAEWAKITVVLNLRAIGWQEDHVARIEDYCRAVRERVHPLVRFRQMCRYLDQRGRQETLKGDSSVAEGRPDGGTR